VEVPGGGTRIGGGTNVIMAAHRPDLPQLLKNLTAVAEAPLTSRQEEALEALALVSLFSGLSRDDLASLAAAARFESRARGEILYRAGDAGDRLFVLRKGAVELERPEGTRSVRRAPAAVGETSAMTGEPRMQTARVTEDADLLTVDSAAFRAVLLRNPFLAVELAKSLDNPGAAESRGR
jgi:CRP-like cAMP-binding protein